MLSILFDMMTLIIPVVFGAIGVVIIVMGFKHRLALAATTIYSKEP